MEGAPRIIVNVTFFFTIILLTTAFLGPGTGFYDLPPIKECDESPNTLNLFNMKDDGTYHEKFGDVLKVTIEKQNDGTTKIVYKSK